MINLKIDTATLRRTTTDVVKRLRAVRTTVERAGSGEVLVSRRTKLPWEKGRALHGRAIANMLADRGHDPFAYPKRVADRSAAAVAEGTAAAIKKAWERGAHQQAEVRALFTAEALELAMFARARILSGGLGTAAKKTQIAKRRLVAKGHVEARFVALLGVRTKRFVDGFRARWRAGRRRA